MANQNLQGTLKGPITFEGPGLHTAKKHRIKLIPAEANNGINFIKTAKKWGGVKTPSKIPASWKNTKKLPLCTCIADENGNQVRTIEHLMAAFYACGIDNVNIEIEGSEIPVMDGSALPFVEAIDQVGVIQQDHLRKVFAVTKAIEVSEGKRKIALEPSDDLELDISISLSHFGRLNWKGNLTPELFKQQMAAARTFGRLKNGLLAKLTYFNKDPICLGANTNSALVLGDKNNVINKEGLRMKDEMIFHRVLDLMGDMMLSGGHIQGRFVINSPAHRLNHQLLTKLFEQQAYERL